MKKKRLDGTDKASVGRGKKRRRRGGRLFSVFIMLLLFSVTVAGSYLYFKPIFVVDSSFIDEIGEGRSRALKEHKAVPGKLYGSIMDEKTTWYHREPRKDAAIESAEGMIRKYLDTYSTNLLDLYMDREGVVYIDMGLEIRKNFSGSADDEYALIAGLCNGIRTHIPEFTALKIMIEGQEVESIGGHIDISRPIRGDIADIVSHTS